MAAQNPSDHNIGAAPLKLLQLQQRFRAGLAGRAREIQAATAGAELQGALHRLVGAAGCYGEEALALQARQALNLLQGAQDAIETAAALQAVAQLCAQCEARAGHKP